MELHYLLFDFSDEESGRGSFDAMASVLPDRFPALCGEIAAVLRWAQRRFGPAGPLDEDGEWDYELQGTEASGAPLEVRWDERRGEVQAGAPGERVTVTLTVCGSAMFCEAFRVEFGGDG